MTASDNYPEMAEQECPICKNPMEKGYIVSRKGIFWNDHIPRNDPLGETVGPYGEVFDGCSYVEAHRCRKCGIFRGITRRKYPLERLPCQNCGEWDEYESLKDDDELRTCPTCLFKF
ncbi:MAG: PF20097 family protein [Candidatus Thorarchaeota archaeon]